MDAANLPIPNWALDMLREARVGHLATASAEAEAHVIPVTFVLIDDALYSAIDEKPKSGRRLKRLRNIEATGAAALVVDHYDEDWSRLAWVLGRGPARILGPDDLLHTVALRALRDKYPQYHTMQLEEAEMVELRPSRWTAWRANERL